MGHDFGQNDQQAEGSDHIRGPRAENASVENLRAQEERQIEGHGDRYGPWEGKSAGMDDLGPHEGAPQITTDQPRKEGKRDNPRHSLPSYGETTAHRETEPGQQPYEQGGNQEGAVDRGKRKNTVVSIAKR